MARLEFEQRIAATPALVAAFFVPQRMPYWYAHEMKAEFEILGGASDFAAGQKVRITGRLGSREVTLTAVVTRYEFGRDLEWQLDAILTRHAVARRDRAWLARLARLAERR